MLKAKCRFAAEYWCRDVPITVAGSLLHIVFVLVEFCQSSDENVPENNSAINKYKKKMGPPQFSGSVNAYHSAAKGSNPHCPS